MSRPIPARLSILLIATLVNSGAYAQSGSASPSPEPKAVSAQQASDVTADAQSRVNDAIPVVGKMKSDPKANDLLGRAKGVVIIPHYLQAALVFGAKGGSGVLLVRQSARWSDPAFFRISGGSFGAQIGGTTGSLVFLLMSDKAVDAFENNASTWSMSAGAGLAAVSYSKQTPETETLSDVIVWSDTKGLFGGAAVAATKISRDTLTNQVYYNNPEVTTQQILGGTAKNPEAKLLVDVMPPPAPTPPPAPVPPATAQAPKK